MKKLLMTALSMVMATGIYAGESWTGTVGWEKEDVKGKVVFYHHWTNFGAAKQENNSASGEMDRWVAEFEAIYPGVEVEQIPITEYHDVMRPRLKTGDYGDVFELQARLLPRHHVTKYAQPLDDLGIQNDVFFPDEFLFDDGVYGYTYGANAAGVVYNKKAFAKAGINEVPSTISGLYEAMAKLKDSGIIPIYLNVADGWPLQNFANNFPSMAAGTSTFNNELMLNDTSPFDADKPWGQSIRTVKTIIENGWSEPDLSTRQWQDSKFAMAAGNSAMWFLGNWSINQIIQEGGASLPNYDPETIGNFPFPVDNSGKPRVRMAGDHFMAVSKYSKNPIAAKAWIHFLVTKSDLSQVAGLIPTYKKMKPTLSQLKELDSYNPIYMEKVPDSETFTKVVNKSRVGLDGNMIRDIVTSKDFEGALTNLNRKWKKTTKRYVK